MSTNTTETLIALGQHRWLPYLLVEIARTDGARFVELLHRMGISRESLSRTLEGGISLGWIVRNPGHGHPLRPEYLLSETGKFAAVCASNILQAEQQSGLPPFSMNRWSRPIIHVIGEGERRYSAIASKLTRSNPRALTQSLKSLIAHRLVDRRILDGYPPASEYALTDSGVIIARSLVA
jgi:DNA-binding HxlR family transcriptional regulator